MKIEKRFFLLIFSTMMLAFLARVAILAAPPNEATPSPTLKEEEIKDKIKELKERLATRVAQLQAQSRRAFFGQIGEKGENTLTLVRGGKEQKVIIGKETTISQVDPTQKKTTISAEALAVGDKIVVFGNLDLDQKTLLAKIVLRQVFPKNIYGEVVEVDINAGTLTVSTKKEVALWVIDYEIRTECKIWQKEEGLQKCGLSKIKVGDRVFVRGIANKKEENRLTALRLLLLPAKQAATPTPSPQK